MMTDVETDEQLYAQLSPELIRYATALTGPADAPDVVADAVIACFGSRHWPTVTNKRAYLYRAVLNQAHTHGRSAERRLRRERRTSDRLEVAPAADSVDARRALAHLSPQQRAVVFLTYWEDRTPAHIADLLGVAEGTVRKQLARSREHLRRILDDRTN